MNSEQKSLEIEITEAQYQNPEISKLLDRYEDQMQLLVGQPKTSNGPRKVTFYNNLTLRIEANFAEPGKYELLQTLMDMLNIVKPVLEPAEAEDIETIDFGEPDYDSIDEIEIEKHAAHVADARGYHTSTGKILHDYDEIYAYLIEVEREKVRARHEEYIRANS